jgi:signal transduction histidine kinase
LRKKNFFLFFFIPLSGIVIIFFILSSLNRRFIRVKVEDLVKEQLQATAQILKADVSHFLMEDSSPEEIFELYSGEENIYFMALLDNEKKILGWRSRFEGYLPLSRQTGEEKDSWIIDSPVGKIFNIFSSFNIPDNKTYYLYLGYSLKNLEEMLAHSRQSFLVVFVFIVLIGFIFFLGLFQLQSHYLRKKREAEEEKKEKERYREISAFTSGVAHEIKNPLNRLSLLFELLKKRIPAALEEDVSLGKEEIQKISRIIDQFSTSLKPIDLKKEQFRLQDLISEIKKSLTQEIREKRVDIQYSQHLPIVLHADKGLLNQAFLNLLRNSLEASDEGNIMIRAARYKKKILITIKDNGRGIPEEDKDYVFDPFFSRKKEGMGVGLYLTKKIIEAHEGRITFQSEPGQGTTFLIHIPGG